MDAARHNAVCDETDCVVRLNQVCGELSLEFMNGWPMSGRATHNTRRSVPRKLGLRSLTMDAVQRIEAPTCYISLPENTACSV